MFGGSLRRARERVLAAASAHLEPGETIQVVATALERWRIGRAMAISAIVLFPVLFLMEMNGVRARPGRHARTHVRCRRLGRTGAIYEAPRAHRPTATGARIDVDGATRGDRLDVATLRARGRRRTRCRLRHAFDRGPRAGRGRPRAQVRPPMADRSHEVRGEPGGTSGATATATRPSGS